MQGFTDHSRVANRLVIAVMFTLGCGAKMEVDNTGLSGTSGTTGQIAGTSGTSNLNTGHVSSGGTAGQLAGTSGAGNLGGAAPVDAGLTVTQWNCSAQAAWEATFTTPNCCGYGGTTHVNTTAMVDCAIALPVVPEPDISCVAINCTVLAGLARYSTNGVPAPPADGWNIDYTNDSARLVLGATFCEQVKSLGDVPVYVYPGCQCVN